MKIVTLRSKNKINVTCTGVEEPEQVNEVVVNLDNMDGFFRINEELGENRLLGVAITFANMKVLAVDIVDRHADQLNTKYDSFLNAINSLDTLRSIDSIELL